MSVRGIFLNSFVVRVLYFHMTVFTMKMIIFWKGLGPFMEFRKGGSQACSDAYASSVKPSAVIREKEGEERGLVTTTVFKGEIRKEKETVQSQTLRE